MKSLVATLALAVSFASAAQAKSPKFFTIDMTGRHFVSDGFNMMDDGMPGDINGLQIKLDGKIGVDFVVEAKASTPGDRCEVLDSRSAQGKTLVRIDADPEVDSGETCNITITYKNGRSATLSIESQGT